MMFGTWKSGEYKHVDKGILEMSNNLECPICLETKECISQPRCILYIIIVWRKTEACLQAEVF